MEIRFLIYFFWEKFCVFIFVDIHMFVCHLIESSVVNTKMYVNKLFKQKVAFTIDWMALFVFALRCFNPIQK